MSRIVPVYLEVGARRVVAGALDWPGWCRHGRDADEALAALFAHGERYGKLFARTRLGFEAPDRASRLKVVERLRGNATTDFGVPGRAPDTDLERTCDDHEVERFERILRALWRAFDATVELAHGKTLATGPRGGGRTLERILSHVIEADRRYLTATGGAKVARASVVADDLTAVRAAILATLRASAAGAIPVKGPRGGDRWTARYFARRVAYHVTSHLWEIERRLPAKQR